MSLSGTDSEKLVELCSMTYENQAIWWLNAYWHKYESEAEQLWKFVEKMNELDLAHHENKDGNALDEMQAHVFLEHFKETMTVRQMRENLRKVGAIGEKERVKEVPLTHILVVKYQVDFHTLVNASQGDNQAEVEAAKEMLRQVELAFQAAEARAEEAKQAEAAARQAEAAAKQAQAELEAALADLKAQEDAYANKTKQLEEKSQTGGVVSRNKAKAELEIHLAEDPLPLRRAKITTEAAVKKADRCTKAAEEATQAAVAARKAAQDAVAEAARQVQEAQAFLDEVKAKGGGGQGSLWWMDRQLIEKRKFLPTSKGGIARNRK